MDASTMVNKMLMWGVCCVAAILIGGAVLQLSRSRVAEENVGSQSFSAAEITTACSEMPLTEMEVLECSHAFEEICNAYSNLQFETMQERFCGISNKVVRLGKGQLDKLIDPLQITFRERFWSDSRNLPDFATVSNFDRHLNANVVAVKILGFSIAANDVYNTDLLGYDVVVFKRITAYLRKFKENGNEQLALSAQMHLDEWKEYLASEQSLTRIYLRHQLMGFLKWPRWRAEDLGMKSKKDWIVYMRNYALKFHEQNYGIVPKWLDEEFPLPQNGEDIKTNPVF